MTPVRRRRCAAAAVSAALIHLPAWAQEPPSRAALPAPQPAAQAAPSESLPIPALSLADVTEEGQHLLRATVTLKGEPLQGARVQFGAARTFGVLDLGTDTSLDDGTAAIPFPEGLPGDAAGTFEAAASIEASRTYSAASVRTRMGGVGAVEVRAEPPPSALWSSRPLWPLVSVIAVLLAGVWSVYVFVIAQLVKIRREEYPP